MNRQRASAFDFLRSNPDVSGAELARQLEIPARSARRYRRAFAEQQLTSENTYIFTGAERNEWRIPVFTGYPRVAGNWVVTGDVHLPTTDMNLARNLLDTARFLNIRKLAIVGDLLNMDAFSKYDHIVPPISFAAEVEPAVALIKEYAGWFDRIVMVLGNHEHRLMKPLHGHMKAEWFGRILDAGGNNLEVSPYSYMELTSGNELWRLTHPGNYSTIKGRVADQLAQKFQCNIVSFHEHHVAKLRDKYNRYTIINGGMLAEPDEMAYVKLVDTTSAEMCKGFVVIKDGHGDLVTPYASYTDFERYGIDERHDE